MTEHNCAAEHISSRLVVEHRPDGSVWRGVVDTFDLTGHPQSDRCYAWVDESAGGAVCTVLRIAPVKSVQTAVRTVLVQRAAAAEA